MEIQPLLPVGKREGEEDKASPPYNQPHAKINGFYMHLLSSVFVYKHII